MLGFDGLPRNFCRGGVEVDAAGHGADSFQKFRRRMPFEFPRVECDRRVFGGGEGAGSESCATDGGRAGRVLLSRLQPGSVRGFYR
jgi:hypothetical protein